MFYSYLIYVSLLQDKFAELSQNRAREAAKNGVFSEEIVPVKVTSRKVCPVLFSTSTGHENSWYTYMTLRNRSNCPGSYLEDRSTAI